MPDINITTGITSWGLGDILIGSAPGRSARLPGSTDTILRVLTQQGTGQGSNKPYWSDLSTLIPKAGDGKGGLTTLTGDVTTVEGSSVATIAPKSVTNSKLALMPPLTIKGNKSILKGPPQDLTVADLLSMGIGGGGGGGGSGTVTSVGLSVPVGLVVSGTPVTTSGTLSITTSLAGVLRGTGTGFAAATPGTDFVAPGSLLSSGLTLPTARLAGRTTAGVGAVEGITVGTGLTLSGGTLSATSVGTGTVTSVGLTVPSFLSVAGSPVTTSGTLAVTLATQAANLLWAGPATGAAATPVFRSLVTADFPGILGTLSGLTNALGFLHNDGAGVLTWAAAGGGGGTGDVVGPSGATDHAIARFDTATGKLLEDSTATLSDGGTLITTELDATIVATPLLTSLVSNGNVAITPDGTGKILLGNVTPEINFPIGALNINALTIRSSTANAQTYFNILPNGSATDVGVLLYGGNDPDLTGQNIMGFGGGFAGAVAGSWNFGSINKASPSSDSRPISFVLSNAADGRFEFLRFSKDGQLQFKNAKPEIQWPQGALNANSLTLRSSSTNASSFFNLCPNGAGTEACIILHGNTDPDATGHNVFGFGSNFGGAIAGSWSFGSFNYASPSSDSRPISFVVSNSGSGRIEAMRMLISGAISFPQIPLTTSLAITTATKTFPLTINGVVVNVLCQ